MKKILLSLLLLLGSQFLTAQIVITEIMYNNAGADELEFVELYNLSSDPVNLQGYTFTAGIDYTFGDVTMNSGDFVVVCTDSVLFDAVFGIAAYEWTNGALTNTGELIELSDANGNIIDMVDYDDSAPWSVFADGNGPSLILCDPTLDNNEAASWQASSTDTGIEYSNVPLLASPGAASPCTNASPLLSLSEFELSVSENEGNISLSVLLENPTSTATTVDIIVDDVSSAELDTDFTLSATSLTFPANTADAQVFEVTLIDDTEIEALEQITLKLTNANNEAILLTDSLNILVADNDTPLNQDMILTGVFDAQLPGMAGTKGFEVYVRNDIPDLSTYGLGVANNGGGSDGLEWSFPSGSATAGTFLYIAEDSTEFHDYFGFAADYISGVAAINGDDAVEVYENAQVIDVYGDVEIDGSGEPWEYLDGWAYRRQGTGPDGATFVLTNWQISGNDALDGAETNADAPTPFPIRTYGIPTSISALDDMVSGLYNAPITIDVLTNDFVPGTVESVTIIFSSGTTGSISVNEDFQIIYTPVTDFCGTDIFEYEVCDETGCDQGTVTVNIACPPSYPAYAIATVTTNNTEGVADSIDVSCELAGRVYGVNIKNDGGLSFVILDAANDGIVVFRDEKDFGYTVNEGDEVVVRGIIDQYNGLTEIIADTVFTTTLGIAEVAPTVVTELNENTESQLVSIEGLQPINPSQWDPANGSSGFNVDFTNGIDTFTIRIDNDTELYNADAPQVVANGTYTITGLGGQFDFTSPFDGGYQLLPRYAADINIVTSTTDLGKTLNVKAFPNPSNQLVFVQTTDLYDHLRLVNMLGQELYLKNEPTLLEQISVQHLPKGIYNLILEKGTERVSYRISVQ